jgi:hypothetical protein
VEKEDGVEAAAGATGWMAVGYVLLATVLGSFAALWAQGAPVNRGMRAALYVTVGFVGCLFLLIGLIAVLIPFINPVGPLAIGLAIALPLWRPFRQVVARVIPIDPASATHAMALIAVLLVLLLALADWLAALSGQPPAPAPASPALLTAQHLALIPLSLFSVGLWLRRDWPHTRQRLGLAPLSGRDLLLALLAALVSVTVTIGLRLATPGSAPADRLTEALVQFAPGLLPAVVVGLAAAVGLELLFRGALQPRLGLPLTALAFVAVHAIYPPTWPLLGLVTLAIALGLLRWRASTTACIAAHAAYNLLLVAWLLLIPR